jgi:hypothetical protein
MAEYKEQQEAERKKTERLRALRLAKESQSRQEQMKPGAGKRVAQPGPELFLPVQGP